MMTIVINHDASYTIDDNRHNHNASYTNDDNCHDRIVHTLAIDDAAEILLRTNGRTNGQGDSRSRICPSRGLQDQQSAVIQKVLRGRKFLHLYVPREPLHLYAPRAI